MSDLEGTMAINNPGDWGSTTTDQGFQVSRRLNKSGATVEQVKEENQSVTLCTPTNQ